MLNTVEELIEAVGGNDAACTLTGVQRPAISNWKARGVIPPSHWMTFERELKKLDQPEANPALFFAKRVSAGFD